MAPKKNDIIKELKSKELKSKELKTKELEIKEPEIKESEIKEPEIIESEESEGEESESEESEESRSESEESEESESEESKNLKKSVKEKKIKKTWQENINELTQLISDFKKYDSEHKVILENFYKNEKTRSEIGKQLVRIVPLLNISMEKGIKEGKIKPKRKGNSSSGFNKEGPVPPKLIKYLDIDDEIHMSRPKVVHLLYTKFKNDNLTTGQNIIFDKNTAKFFGKDKDYELNFKQIQTFLKEIYDEAFPKS